VNIIPFSEFFFNPVLSGIKDYGTQFGWGVVTKAVDGLKLNKVELEFWKEKTGRFLQPAGGYKEIWIVCGRRGGKTHYIARRAVWRATCVDYRPFISAGETVVIVVVAETVRQAGILFRYILGLVNGNRMFAKEVETVRANSVDFKNQVSIQVMTSSFRSIRGITAGDVYCDEFAYWPSDNMVYSSREFRRAVIPATGSIPTSQVWYITTPYARMGDTWQARQDHFGNDESDTLYFEAPTRSMNPTISQSIIDRDMGIDPEAAKSEWLAEFRSDLESFLSFEQIMAVVVQNRYELPPVPGVRYHFFVDPSGGRRDSAALSGAHLEQGRIILDVARRWKAPHDPARVVSEMAALLKSYGVHRIVGDRYAGAWPAQEFAKHNISYEPSDKDKSQIYIDFLPLVLSQRVELLDNKVLISELRNLERRTRSAGRDLVDHGPRGFDDLSNSCAGVCARLGTTPRQIAEIRQLKI
jgi:hypothetical protein